METKIKLSDKQKEVIRLMREGQIINVDIREGNKVNKYYLGNSIRPMRRNPVYDLFVDGLLEYKQINYCKATFTLTELGKTIPI